MEKSDRLELSSTLFSLARELGADLTGIARVKDLENCPSGLLAPQLPTIKVGLGKDNKKPGQVTWPDWARSILIIGLSHPESKPEMDWWYGEGSPPGNQELIAICRALKGWLQENYPGMKVSALPYHVEEGGIFLKDAAVMAGLGIIGRNNLLISPLLGPRLRLRALLLEQELPSTGPLNFDPCSHCEQYCLDSCPEEAFAEVFVKDLPPDLEKLPAIQGNYSRLKCHDRMEKDLAAGSGEGEQYICKFCRACEFSCPVGRIKGAD